MYSNNKGQLQIRFYKQIWTTAFIFDKLDYNHCSNRTYLQYLKINTDLCFHV